MSEFQKNSAFDPEWNATDHPLDLDPLGPLPNQPTQRKASDTTEVYTDSLERWYQELTMAVTEVRTALAARDAIEAVRDEVYSYLKG